MYAVYCLFLMLLLLVIDWPLQPKTDRVALLKSVKDAKQADTPTDGQLAVRLCCFIFICIAAKKATSPKPGKEVQRDAFQGSNDVYAFGWGQSGAKGDVATGGNPEEAANSNTPKLLENLLGKGVMQVACGWSHTAVLLGL